MDLEKDEVAYVSSSAAFAGFLRTGAATDRSRLTGISLAFVCIHGKVLAVRLGVL
jgi:hypothetical protein